MNNWKAKRILVIGAARQGQAAARYLAAQGALVTLNDEKPAEKITLHGDIFHTKEIKKSFGGHSLELLDNTDLICVSGGVPLSLPIIAAGMQRGIPITNDSQIFLQSVKSKVIGITGSAGKTTTTTLVGAIAKRNAKNGQKAWVGGNIGNPLIESLSEINKEDFVILELSSFQLELMTKSPNVACVLNITPNHLDRHGTMQKYSAAKENILKFQGGMDHAVLNSDDTGSWILKDIVKGPLWTFSFTSKNVENAIFCENESIIANIQGKKFNIMPIGEIRLIGRHNLANTLAACAVSLASEFEIDTIRAGISEIQGIPHRLEFVREVNGVKWINDSIATAPERTMAALEAVRGPLVLLLGGKDKNLPWDVLAASIHMREPKVVVFGEAADLIESNLHQFEKNKPSYRIEKAESFIEAIEIAKNVAKAGDTVLLSPGCTSYDEFQDFEQRGAVFREAVKNL